MICGEANGVDDVRSVQRSESQSKCFAGAIDAAANGKEVPGQSVRSRLMDVITEKPAENRVICGGLVVKSAHDHVAVLNLRRAESDFATRIRRARKLGRQEFRRRAEERWIDSIVGEQLGTACIA